MGNRLSCIYPAPGSDAGIFIRIVHALDGRTCELEEPMKVGELMLEFPGHFVTEYDEQQQSAGKRVSALPADHDTCAYHVYVLLPMHRLNTRLSAEELHRIATPACKSRAPAYTTKVTPLSAHQYEQAAEKGHTLQSTAGSYSLPVLDVFEEDGPQQQPHQHVPHSTLRSMRPWAPKLDTIVESSPLTV